MTESRCHCENLPCGRRETHTDGRVSQCKAETPQAHTQDTANRSARPETATRISQHLLAPQPPRPETPWDWPNLSSSLSYTRKN